MLETCNSVNEYRILSIARFQLLCRRLSYFVICSERFAHEIQFVKYTYDRLANYEMTKILPVYSCESIQQGTCFRGFLIRLRLNVITSMVY